MTEAAKRQGRASGTFAQERRETKRAERQLHRGSEAATSASYMAPLGPPVASFAKEASERLQTCRSSARPGGAEDIRNGVTRRQLLLPRGKSAPEPPGMYAARRLCFPCPASAASAGTLAKWPAQECADSFPTGRVCPSNETWFGWRPDTSRATLYLQSMRKGSWCATTTPQAPCTPARAP